MDEKKLKRAGMVAIAVPVLAVGTAALASAYRSEGNFQPFTTNRELQKNQVAFDDEGAVEQRKQDREDESEYWKKDNDNQEKSPSPGNQDGKYLFENGLIDQADQQSKSIGVISDTMADAVGNQTGSSSRAGDQSIYNLTNDSGKADMILQGSGGHASSVGAGTESNGKGSNGKENTDKNQEADKPLIPTPIPPENPERPTNPTHPALTAKDPESTKKVPNFSGMVTNISKYTEDVIKDINNSENRSFVRIIQMDSNPDAILYKGQRIDQRKIYNALDTYVQIVDSHNELTIYAWDSSALGQYIRIDAVSFDGGTTWDAAFPVTIPEQVDATQMRVRVSYRLSTKESSWTQQEVAYEPKDSRVYVLSEKLNRQNQTLDNAKILNAEFEQYKEKGNIVNLFSYQNRYLGENKRLTVLFPGWTQNGENVEWFYRAETGRQILEPSDPVNLDPVYVVRLTYQWMTYDYQVNPAANTLCYLQTLTNIDKSKSMGSIENGHTFRVPKYIQTVEIDKNAEIVTDYMEIPDTVLYIGDNSAGMKVRKGYRVAEANKNYGVSAKGYLTNKSGTEYLGIPYEVETVKAEKNITKVYINKENAIHTIQLEADTLEKFPEITYANLKNCKIIVKDHLLEAFAKKYWDKLNTNTGNCIATETDASKIYTVESGCLLDQDGFLQRVLLPKGSTLRLPEEVTTIGADAFNEAQQLNSLLIPEKVKEIKLEKNCLRNSGIQRIFCYTEEQYEQISSQLKEAGASDEITVELITGVSKEGYVYLTKEKDEKRQTELILAPDDITYFDGSITTEDGKQMQITQIDDYAFSDAQNLEWAILQEQVKKIGYGAFENCSALQGIMIYSKDTIEIGDQAFEGCTSLRFVASNAKKAVMDNDYAPVITDKSGYNKAFYVPTFNEGYNSSAVSFTEESGVSSYQVIDTGKQGKVLCGNYENGKPWLIIREGAICDEQVKLPETTVEIFISAFEETTAENGMYTIAWGELSQLRYIDGEAFRGSQLGGTVVFGDGCLLGDGALSYCRNITGVIMGTEIGDIGVSAFSGCSSLKTVEFGGFGYTGDRKAMLSSNLFYECDQLTNIRFLDSDPPELLLSGNIKFQFNSAWSSEEAAGLQVEVPAGSEEIYMKKWRYGFAGYYADSDPAYVNMWNSVYMKLIDWDTWEIPADEEVDQQAEAELLEAENVLRSILGMHEVKEPTDYYPYHPRTMTLVGVPSYSTSIDLRMNMEDLREGSHLENIGTGAFRRAKNLSDVFVPYTISGIYTNAFEGVESSFLTLCFESAEPPKLLGWSKEHPFVFGANEENIHIELVWSDTPQAYLQSWIFSMAGYEDLEQMRESIKADLTAAGVDDSGQAVDCEVAKQLLPVENRLRKMLGLDLITKPEELCITLENLSKEDTEEEEKEEVPADVSEKGTEDTENEKADAVSGNADDQPEENTGSVNQEEKSFGKEESGSVTDKKDNEISSDDVAEKIKENPETKESQKNTDTAADSGSGEETQG